MTEPIDTKCPHCDSPIEIQEDGDFDGERYVDESTWDCTKCAARWSSDLDEMDADEFIEWQITEPEEPTT